MASYITPKSFQFLKRTYFIYIFLFLHRIFLGLVFKYFVESKEFCLFFIFSDMLSC